MAVFLKYLMILLVHLIWEHIGGRGPVPPIRVPKKGPVTLPAISGWHVLIAFWLTKQLWSHYGQAVGGKVQERAKDRCAAARDRVNARVAAWKAARAAKSGVQPEPEADVPRQETPVFIMSPATTEIPSPIPGMPLPARG